MSLISRLYEGRARTVARRLDEYSTRFNAYYRLAVQAGETMFRNGEPCPRMPRESDMVEFDPEASGRRRRDQMARGMMLAQQLGFVHGWTDASSQAGLSPLEVEDAVEDLEAYANGTATRADDR